VAFHAGTRHPQNPPDKGRPSRRGHRINSNPEGILAVVAEFANVSQMNRMNYSLKPPSAKRIISNMATYDSSSRAYLIRAKKNFDSEKNESLFYAALELRCGVEARLKEYVVKGQADGISLRKIPWQIEKLKKILAGSSEIHDKRFVFTFTHPKTGEKHFAIYNPVSSKLQKIAEKLGDFLHCVDQNRVSKSSFFSDFRQLVKQGIEELALATAGTLIAPPVTGPGKMRFKFEKGRVPSLFKDPEIKNYEFKYQVTKSPMPDDPFIICKPI
jgi:hypothetical protein